MKIQVENEMQIQIELRIQIQVQTRSQDFPGKVKQLVGFVFACIENLKPGRRKKERIGDQAIRSNIGRSTKPWQS